MKKPFLLFLCMLSAARLFSQYWQQQADYTIDVRLNEKERALDAFARITYTNHSPDTLHFIWFHLWPNAYKNDRTALSDQLLDNGSTAFYFSNPEERGYINRLDFKVNGTTAKTEDHPSHIDITKLLLPEPLNPGHSITITTPFHVKLPLFYSRSGLDGSTFHITQWFPKPAVYDRKGWHPMPYLDQGEFYSEFGNYDVRINVPENFVVAATGEEIEIERETGRKTLKFVQEKVHDFAWFTDSAFMEAKDTVMLASGRTVTVQAYYRKNQAENFQQVLHYTKRGLRFYSEHLGEYPFNTMTVVQGPEEFSGGMEYPTITMVSPFEGKQLDLVVIHEAGHNWFQQILASNERAFPWMDEGLNSYIEEKYERTFYTNHSSELDLLFRTRVARKTDQPVNLPSDSFETMNYFLSAYHKPKEWLQWLERKYGKEKVEKALQSYYETWKFRHPYPEDFFASFKNILNEEVEKDFALLDSTGLLPGTELKGFSILSPFKKGSIAAYLRQPTKNILFLSPIIGSNSYDKLMIGGVITNYKLPPNRFHYLIVPFYATGSKRFTGLGKLHYSQAYTSPIRKLDIFLNAASFSMNDFTDTAGKRYHMQFNKLVPGVRVSFRNRDPRSRLNRYVQWKSYFLEETQLRTRRDTVISGTDTIPFLVYLFPKTSRHIGQFRMVIENLRELYPYSFQFQIEQSTEFLRPSVEANYYFNYRNGGLQLRFFAGKFIYLGEKTITKQFRTDRYHLNMTGPKGYEDYTYSEYFLGRNEFEGFRSQQIMIRDGGFKVRTDLLASKIGKTDNWLAAINLNTSIPDKLNPLSVLPVKIPLRLFMDIGTYAEAWDKNADTDRFLYDLGIHIPIFHETINFYFPILYNKEYSDYFKSIIPKNRFFKSMSFTINFYNRELKKLNRELEF